MNTNNIESNNTVELFNYDDTIILTSTLFDDSPG